MSEFQRNLNDKALNHLSTLAAVRMDKKNYNQYLDEIGHSSYFGIGREVPVLLDENAQRIEFDLKPSKQPIFVRR